MTTWQGWQHFATTAPPAPPQPGEAPRSREERLAYHSAFVTVRTPAIDTLARHVRTLMILGRHQTTTARPSLIVTGPAAAGKTTALLHVGRTCHLAHTHRNPAPPGSAHPQVPVAYVLVPPGATAKTLTTEFARYLGIPVTTRMTQAQITDAVCHTYNTAGVQLAGRDTLITCGPLPARQGQTRPFTDVITDLENALDLTSHRPGTLPRHHAYLHQRTAGRIGSLTRLIRQAAITAITDGTEKITKAALDAVQLDHLAEQQGRPTRRR
ncbi:TniB family NTP-binding protein [Streptomyces pseudoechinosporeus]